MLSSARLGGPVRASARTCRPAAAAPGAGRLVARAARQSGLSGPSFAGRRVKAQAPARLWLAPASGRSVRVYAEASPSKGTPPQQPGEGSRPAAAAASARNVVVGIDFGTSGSGAAYVSTDGAGSAPRLCVFKRWADAPSPADVKTRTAILYKDSAVDAWGWTAWKRWSSMRDDERKGYVYLNSFKLLLAPEGAAGSAAPTLPPGMTAVQVVADYLTELVRFVTSTLSTAGPLDPSSIGWCLTVPAMWDEEAKAKMRRAAGRAGILPGSLILTLEPEAALLPAAAQAAASTTLGDAAADNRLKDVTKEEGAGSAPPGRPRRITLDDGDVLLVLDCGGGTVDVTLHRVMGKDIKSLRLEELVPGKGVLAGGRYVDEAAWGLVRGLVGPSAWDAWRREQPGEWVALANRWELAKREEGPVELQLPAALMAGAIAAGGKLPRSSLSDSVTLSPDGLLLLREEALERAVLGPQLERALGAAREVLDEGLAEGYKCTKMLLVGGMAESKAVEAAARGLAEGEGVPLLKPANPAAAVVCGAVLYGSFPARVTARIARLTYGISCRSMWSTEDAMSASQAGYPDKIWKEEDRQYFAEGVFEPYVKRGQRVGCDETVRRTFIPTSSSTRCIVIDLYAADSAAARYVGEPGMRKVAELTLDLPEDWLSRVTRRQDYNIEVELKFGSTEVSMAARDTHSRNAVATKVTWISEAAPPEEAKPADKA
ncbi:hypothetical protein HYH03_001776 [Edaphochlamys debaryana]|uniref:Uncharacterized protein n=1 Tax=Edaphochlamys debaryana TaxID=47281 RepID=A0A835YFX1_9CHLO|nr:hypothetical protein HYH03_001776 [Edaphochlamys debaryana]|eukprot:KAG2500196.1 hypothetical protein HYH03_001776 [Edaphochlamys debaryana]